jgi:hypothetical protein
VPLYPPVSTANRLRPLFAIAIAACAILLGRFAFDFSREFPLFAVPFCALVVAALGLASLNAFAGNERTYLRFISGRAVRVARPILIALIPVGFLASSLDCTGLALEGCSQFCTFVKLVWVPLIAVVCFAYWARRRAGLVALLLVMSLVPLFPHCVCDNVANRWWIETIGASPECYAWGATGSVLALSSLRNDDRLWPTVVVCGAIVAGSLAFFVAHHYFHFPW